MYSRVMGMPRCMRTLEFHLNNQELAFIPARASQATELYGHIADLLAYLRKANPSRTVA